MSIADIQARAMSKLGGNSASGRKRYFAAADRARREANLRAEGWVLPISEWLGHNNGPDWFTEVWLDFCWRKARKEAWTGPGQEIAVRRARKAAELGVSYERYVLEILERGRYLDADALAKVH